MKRIGLVVMALILSMSVFAQKKAYINRLRVDSLNIQMLRHCYSNTLLVVHNDTVYYMMANEVLSDSATYADTAAYSIYAMSSDSANYSNVSGNSNLLQGLDTTYIFAHAAVFDTTKCHTLKMDSINICGSKLVINGAFKGGGLSYPISDGTSGQVLITDGSGTLSFGTITQYWSESNNLLYPTDTIDTLRIPTLKANSADITLIQSDSTGKLDTIPTIDITADTLAQMQIDTLYMNGAYHLVGTVTLADDATFNLPVSSGLLSVKVDSVGTEKAAIYSGTWNKDGSTKLVSSLNADTLDTDGKFDFYDGGTYAILKNRLGYSIKLLINLTYYK